MLGKNNQKPGSKYNLHSSTGKVKFRSRESRAFFEKERVIDVNNASPVSIEPGKAKKHDPPCEFWLGILPGPTKRRETPPIHLFDLKTPQNIRPLESDMPTTFFLEPRPYVFSREKRDRFVFYVKSSVGCQGQKK